MKKILTWPRRWHGWLAVVLVVPFMLMAVTGILFAHGNALGTRGIMIDAPRWLPGYAGESVVATQDIRAVAAEGDHYWVATRAGLMLIQGQQAEPVTDLGGEDVRMLTTTPQGVVAVTAKGLWIERNGQWTQTPLKGMVAQVSGDDSHLVAFLRGKGPMASEDGGASWHPLKRALMPALQQLPPGDQPNRISAAQLIHDLHTGVAFLGDKGEWVWVDILGLVLLFLSGSGVYMWWTKLSANRRRAKAAKETVISAS